MAFIPPKDAMNKLSDENDELMKMKSEINTQFTDINKAIDDFQLSENFNSSIKSSVNNAKTGLKSCLNGLKTELMTTVNDYGSAAIDLQRKIKKLDIPEKKKKFPKLEAIYKDSKSISFRGALNALPIPDFGGLGLFNSLSKCGGSNCGIVKSLEKAANSIKDKVSENLNSIMDSVKQVDESVGKTFCNNIDNKYCGICNKIKNMSDVAIQIKDSVESTKCGLDKSFNNAIDPIIIEYIVPNIKCTKETWDKFIKENPDFEKYGKYTWKNNNIVRKNNVD
ncbi:hypothetical protein EOM09_03195 [bacterium]|nr:hypothetical protein [bacterium]